MNDQDQIAPLQESEWKNDCPDVRPGLVVSKTTCEQLYAWMAFQKISAKPYGENNLLLIAPHGFPGDDDNTEILTCLLAEELRSYAVVNNRKYNRKADSGYEFWQDLNRPEEAVQCKDFWNPLMEFTELILRTYVKAPLILFIHGIGNANADEFLGEKVDFAIGAGYEDKYDPKTATASDGLITKLREALTKKLGPAKDGVKGYGATGRVPVLFREKFPNSKIEAIQLEIRCRGYRDSLENIRKLVTGLTQILTDTSEEGFGDYFSTERRPLSTADLSKVSQMTGDLARQIVIDKEFESLIPQMSQEEYRQLEANIIRDGGCRDPLTVWPRDGKLILLDGHHRREICRTNRLPHPAIVEEQLASREEAIRWIAEHQLGRRNLKPFQRIELAHRMEPAIRELAKARQKNAHKFRGKEAETKNETAFHTDEKLATYAGVGATNFRKARDILTHGSQDLIQKCRDGEISIDAAFKQIKKPRKERTTIKKVPDVPTSATQALPEPASELIPQSPPEPSLTEANVSSQSVESLSLPDIPPPCDVIIINMPWEFPSVTQKDIAAIPICDMAQDNCMVWLRATNNKISEAYSLLNEWGFEPKTLFTWIKQESEPAEWLNDRSEHYVVGVKGNPILNPERKFTTSLNTIEAPDHVGKPECFYRSIELYCQGERRLEIFPTAERKGWVSWNPWPVNSAADNEIENTPAKNSKKQTK